MHEETVFNVEAISQSERSYGHLRPVVPLDLDKPGPGRSIVQGQTALQAMTGVEG